MLDNKEKRIADHRKFMEDKATYYLKPLLIDILKEKPTDVLEFMTTWCTTKGIHLRESKNTSHSESTHVDKPKEASDQKLAETSADNPTENPADNPAENPVEAPVNTRLATIEEIVPTTPSNQAPENTKVKNSDLPSSDEEEDIDVEDEQARLDRIASQKGNNKKKMGISAEAYGNYNQQAEFKPPFIEKSAEQIEQITKTLGMSFMFNNLDANDFQSVIGAMSVKEYQDGDYVIKEGDDGAELFIVGQGGLACEKLFPGNEAPTFLKNYHVGEVFGELALMYNVPRAASIISKGPSVCFSLDRDTFNNIVKGAAVKRRNIYEEFLSKIDILADLEVYERSKICDCLLTETFMKGDFVIREGEEGQKFYLLQEGTAIAVKTQNDEEVTVFEYGPNSYFGELALLNNENRKASIKVTSDKLVVASLDKNSFKRMLGPVSKILERNSEKYQKYADHIDQ